VIRGRGWKSGWILILLAGVYLSGTALGAQSEHSPPPGYATHPIVDPESLTVVGTCVEGYLADGRRVSVTFAPNTGESYIQKVMAVFQSYSSHIQYNAEGSRWSRTAYNSSTGTNGDPITLTWSFVPDGVTVPVTSWNAETPSDLFAKMNSQFGGNTTLWQDQFRACFNRWSQVSGIQYIEENDDGAALTSSSGQAGVRGDIRIAACHIDGPYGILAYNYYPDVGDMVLDSDDNWADSANSYRFLRNTLMHEHGHGIGLGHVSPTDQTKLMEPMLSTKFDGPQDDDIRGAQHYYGDPDENNDTSGTATDLSAIDPGPVTLADLSLDESGDHDWFRFTAGTNRRITITATPVGSAYDVGPYGGTVQTINTARIADLQIELRTGDGQTVLTSATAAGIGAAEQIANYLLPSAGGDFQIHLYAGAGSQSDVQRYTLSIETAVVGASLSVPSVTPSSGYTTTSFTFSVTYTQAENQGPEYAYAVIVKPDGTKLWKAMSTGDTTYSDGSVFTCTTKLPAGTHSYYFQFKGVGAVIKTASHSGPTVHSAPTLSNPSLSPASGNKDTYFSFSVTYTQAENEAPEYAYLVIIYPDGTKSWRVMSTTDTTCSDGSQYTRTTKLAPGIYSYYFQFKGAGAVVKTSTFSGPNVYSAPALSDPSLVPTSGTTITEFVFSVTYTQAENQGPEYAYAVIVKPDGTKLWKAMSTGDTTYSDGSVFTCTTKLPAGTHSYYFQFKSAGIVVKTATFTGLEVN